MRAAEGWGEHKGRRYAPNQKGIRVPHYSRTGSAWPGVLPIENAGHHLGLGPATRGHGPRLGLRALALGVLGKGAPGGFLGLGFCFLIGGPGRRRCRIQDIYPHLPQPISHCPP